MLKSYKRAKQDIAEQYYDTIFRLTWYDEYSPCYSCDKLDIQAGDQKTLKEWFTLFYGDDYDLFTDLPLKYLLHYVYISTACMLEKVD